jgi:hypothetical protein
MVTGDVVNTGPRTHDRHLGNFAVVVGREPDQVAALGADRVARLVRVRQVGEEVIDVAGEWMRREQVADGAIWPRTRSCPITGKRTVPSRQRSRTGPTRSRAAATPQSWSDGMSVSWG